MRPGLKDQLEYALRRAAQAGPRPWPMLKAQLVSVGFDSNTLEDNHKDILDIFLVCLSSCGKDPSRYDPEPMSRSRSPPVPRPPASIIPSTASVPSPESSRRSPSSNMEPTTAPTRGPEEGWIRLKEKSREKADLNFCFGPKPENTIGTHIIDRYTKQLRPRINDDTIDLECCLYSQPGRTYVIKFQIEDSEAFDILLGRYWKGDKLKEVQSNNEGASTTRRDSRGQSDLSSAQSTHATGRGTNAKGLGQSTPLYPPEYLADFFKALNTPSKPQLNQTSMPSRRWQDKQAGLDTDPEYTKLRPKKHARVRLAPSQSDSMTDDTPRLRGDNYLSSRKASPAPRAKVGRESDASVSQSSVFDTDDSQGDESGGSDITSPDQSSDHQEALASRFAPAFLAAVDVCFGQVDPAQPSNEFGYECE